MYKLKFNANELPYREFEKVGLSKKDVLSLPVDSLNALLSGRRSDFIRINADGMKLDVKTSLQRNPDSSVSLRFHPINRVAPNVYNLSEAHEKMLQNSDVKGIVVESKKQNGEPVDILVQYDSDTKEYVSINLNDIPLPEKINDVKLTEQQRSDWKNGKEIVVDGEPARLSLTNTMGFVGKIFMFALDGGISIAIAAIVKEYNKREAERNTGKVNNGTTNGTTNNVSGTYMNSSNGGIKANPETKGKNDFVNQAVKSNEPVQTKSSNNPNERVGILVDHGPAPYNHKPNEKPSYFAVLNQDGKESTIWGLGLKSAIEKSGVQKGDEISLQKTGREPVTVTADRKDESGKTINTEVINTHRNEWKVDDLKPSTTPDVSLKENQVKTPASQPEIIPLENNIKNLRPEVEQAKSNSVDLLTPNNVLTIVANNTYNTNNEVSNNVKVGDNVTFMTQMGERTAVWDGEFFQSDMGTAELSLVLPVESSWGFVRNDSQIQRELGSSQDVNQLVRNAEFQIEKEKDSKTVLSPEVKSGLKSETSGNKETQVTKNSSESQNQQNEWKQADRSQRGIKR